MNGSLKNRSRSYLSFCINFHFIAFFVFFPSVHLSNCFSYTIFSGPEMIWNVLQLLVMQRIPCVRPPAVFPDHNCWRSPGHYLCVGWRCLSRAGRASAPSERLSNVVSIHLESIDRVPVAARAPSSPGTHHMHSSPAVALLQVLQSLAREKFAQLDMIISGGCSNSLLRLIGIQS